MSDEERKAIDYLQLCYDLSTITNESLSKLGIVLNLIERQSKEIEELKETLKCTQNSWFEDTQKIEEMKKQIDLDNECEIALNSKVMDLEKEIEELKENNKTLKKLQNDTSRLYIEMIERKNYFERKLEKLEDKIKAKIEEVQDGTYDAKIVLQSLLEKE